MVQDTVSNNHFNKDNDPVFLEESKQLKRSLMDIMAEMGRTLLSKDNLEDARNDYDKLNKTISQHIYAINKILDPLKSLIEDYNSMLTSPYHGRVEMEHIDKYGKEIKEIFFIGRNYFDGGDYHIINWTLPVAKAFYERNSQTIEDKEGTIHELILRRALIIENRELIQYENLFAQEAGDKNIVDPFLIRILKDKRRKNVTTDIVETIQEEQYKIISEPLSKQFIVQGCAGSGKTMVLLHRLAYLIDNNKHFEPKNYLILTPNNFFDEHIDEVTKDLRIKSVKRSTVEEYFLELLDAYEPRLKPDGVISDRLLNTQVLKDLYSVRIISKLQRYYEEYWGKVLIEPNIQFMVKKCCPEVLETAIPKYDSEKEIKSKYTVHTSEYIQSKVESFIKAQKSDQEHYVDLLNKLHNVSVTYENREQLTEQRRMLIDSAKEKIIAVIDREILNLQSASNIQEKIERLTAEIGSLSKDVKVTIAALNSLGVKHRSYETKVRRMNPNGFKKIRDKQLEKYEKEEERLNNLLLEFSRKHVLKKQELENLQNSGYADDKEIAVLEKAKTILEKRVISHLIKSELGIKDAFVDVEIQEYNKYADGFNSFVRSFDAIKVNIETYQKEITRIKSTKLSQDEMKILEETLPIFGRKTRYSSFLKESVIKLISEVFASHGMQYDGADYRFTLPLKLAFCKLYYDRRLGKHIMVSVDEAQDLGYMEYKVLFNAMPPNIYLNLYGDTDQLIYDYKGLSSWEQILEYYDDLQSYTLNQNYRNTEQITEYTNEKLGKQIQAIGIHGEAVHPVDMQLGIKQAIEKLRGNKNRRIAVVYDTESIDMRNNIHEWLDRYDTSVEKLHKLVKVMSVEEVKGMEFDAVVVFTANMTDNEKYVAFTRALDCLYVVK